MLWLMAIQSTVQMIAVFSGSCIKLDFKSGKKGKNQIESFIMLAVLLRNV